MALKSLPVFLPKYYGQPCRTVSKNRSKLRRHGCGCLCTDEFNW